MLTPANDNFPEHARRIEPFHRLYAEGLLHKNEAMNAKLFYIGQRYARSFEVAGSGSVVQSPDYAKPMVSGGSYDAYRDVPIAERRIDKLRSFYDAAKILEAVHLRDLVDAIVIYGTPVVEAGKDYSGRKQDQQARSAAITALSIGLTLLNNHYLSLNVGKLAA